MITIKGKSTDEVIFLTPSAGIRWDSYGFIFGIYFLFWGVELEYEKPQYKR